MKPEEIARVCHEANRGMTQIIGDVPVQGSWDEVSGDMQASCVRGVQFNIENPDATPADSHAEWMTERLSQGWKLGPIKDAEKKEHPALVPYEQLPDAVRLKDKVFKALVGALK